MHTPLTYDEILQVIRCAPWCRLALCENDHPYVVPMDFCYRWDKGKLVFTLCSLSDGRKMHCMLRNNKVCLEFERCTCRGTETVLVFGTARFIGPMPREEELTNDCAAEERFPREITIEVTTTEITGKIFARCCRPCHK